MKRAILLATVAALAFGVVSPAASAQPTNFRAVLSGGNEVPAVDTLARGVATFQLSDDGTELTYRLVVANIENVVAAHIHLGPAGVNGPVVAFLFSGAPSGRSNGVLARGDDHRCQPRWAARRATVERPRDGDGGREHLRERPHLARAPRG